MPRPVGWTASEERLRDECVMALLREGVPPGRTGEERARSDRSRAFAICTASVEKHRRGGNPTAADVIVAAKRMFVGLVRGA